MYRHHHHTTTLVTTVWQLLVTTTTPPQVVRELLWLFERLATNLSSIIWTDWQYNNWNSSVLKSTPIATFVETGVLSVLTSFNSCTANQFKLSNCWSHVCHLCTLWEWRANRLFAMTRDFAAVTVWIKFEFFLGLKLNCRTLLHFCMSYKHQFCDDFAAVGVWINLNYF